MKRSPAAVSYHCTIGNMKSRQDAKSKLQVWVAADFVFGLIYVFIVPLHLRLRPLRAATTLFPFESAVKPKKKSLNCETGGLKRPELNGAPFQ